MKQMFALPAQECPPPAKVYECPICHWAGRHLPLTFVVNIGRTDRPTQFPFQVDRDMLPGQLARNHIFSMFITNFALLTHFRRASCPVLLCEWAKREYFGSHIESIEPLPPAQSTIMET